MQPFPPFHGLYYSLTVCQSVAGNKWKRKLARVAGLEERHCNPTNKVHTHVTKLNRTKLSTLTNSKIASVMVVTILPIF